MKKGKRTRATSPEPHKKMVMRKYDNINMMMMMKIFG